MQKNNRLSSNPNDWNRNGPYGGQATLTNKVDGARDEASFDLIELFYTKNVWNKKIIIFLAPLMTDIEMVSIVVKQPMLLLKG